ncbi:MAG: hypothetical protein AAGJ19_18890 [Myxococcota bacterium]
MAGRWLYVLGAVPLVACSEATGGLTSSGGDLAPSLATDAQASEPGVLDAGRTDASLADFGVMSPTDMGGPPLPDGGPLELTLVDGLAGVCRGRTIDRFSVQLSIRAELEPGASVQDLRLAHVWAVDSESLEELEGFACCVRGLEDPEELERLGRTFIVLALNDLLVTNELIRYYLDLCDEQSEPRLVLRLDFTGRDGEFSEFISLPLGCQGRNCFG